MTSNIAEIIADYRERCAQLLQNAAPDSDEHRTYSRIIQAFDQNQTGEPVHRSAMIVQVLEGAAYGTRALRLAPPETHARAARERAIITQWAMDFKRDTGNTHLQFIFH